jgi:hypothetical protein
MTAAIALPGMALAVDPAESPIIPLHVPVPDHIDNAGRGGGDDGGVMVTVPRRRPGHCPVQPPRRVS